MNFDGGTVKYTFEADTGGLEEGFNRVRKSVEDTVANFKELERAEEIESLKKGIEFLSKELETLDENSEQYRLTARALAQELDQLQKIEAEVAEESVKAAESTRKAEEEMARAAKEASEALVSSRVNKMNSLWSSFTKLATGATASLVGLAKKGVSATNFLETSQTAMSGLLGSMEEGKKAMGVAADFWSNNPFNRFDVTSATKQLVQYGRSVNQLSDDLKILGNVSLSTGMDIDDLAIRYGRVASSGRAMTLDIETMSARGVPIYRELAKVLGTTQQGVRDLASQGKIDFETFKTAMEGAVDPEAMEQYEQTLDRAKDKLSGSVTTLAGALAGYKIVNSEIVVSTEGIYKSWIKLLRAIAGNSKEGTGLRNKELIEGLTKIGQEVGKIIDKIADNIQPIFDFLGKIAKFISNNTATLIPILAGALSFLAKFGAQIPVIGNLFGGWAGKIGKTTNAIMKFVATKPLLTAFIAILSAGFVSLIQSDEQFREDLASLATSLGNIIKSILPVVQTLASAFMSLATSATVQAGLKLIVNLVARLAELLASIPSEVLLTVVSAILAIKMASINPWLVWITAIGLVIDILKDLAPDFYNAAHNAIIGFVNGITEGTRNVVEAIKKMANAAYTAIKNALGIHSPSTVMEGVGLNIGLGLAKGVNESSSIVNKAMNNLAKDILSTANKVISNRKEFGLIDYNGMYKDWKKVANLFTIGSEQYETALEQMEEARKQVNLEIINLQENYNDKLDESIKKIQTFYGIFDDVSTKGGKNSQEIIKNLDKQVAQTSEWAEAQKIISGLDLDPKFVEELQSLGVSSVSELSSIANMTSSELEQMNTLWLQKQEIATDEATRQLANYKDETLKQIDELADGIDGETVKVEDIGGRLVSSVGDGITGALPTLDLAFAKLDSYIADAMSSVSGSGSGGGIVPEIESDENEDEKEKNLLELLGLPSPEEMADWVSSKLPVLLGTVGAGALLKFAPSIIKKLKGSGIASKISDALKGEGLLSKLGGLTKGGKQTLDVGSSADLSGINKTTSEISKTSKGLSKVSEVLNVVIKGAAAIAMIAVAIAAIAGAIWVMDNALRDIDWGTFISKLGMVAVATAAMGVIAGVIGKFAAKEVAIGGAIVLEIAVDIAAIAAAIGFADWAMSGVEDWKEFGNKLGMMAAAIAAFAVIDGALGAITPVAAAIAIGGAIVLEIAADIIAISFSIGEMDANIPNDLGRVKDKFIVVAEVIGGMTVLQGLNGILAPLEFLGGFSIKSEADSLVRVAAALRFVDENVPNNLDNVKSKFGLIRTTLEELTEANFGKTLKNVVQASRIETLRPTVRAFADIAEDINRVAGVQVDEAGILGIVRALSAIVENGNTLENYARLGSGVAESVARGVQEGLPFLYQAGNAIQTALWQGVQDKFADEYQQGVYLAYSLRDGIVSVLGTFETVGGQVQSKFWWGVESKKQDEYYQGRSMGEIFRQGLYDVDYGNSGWWAIQGFINGAWGRAGSYDGLYNTGRWVTERFLQGIRDRAGEGSPWKTTFQSGVWAGEGLIEGIESMEDKVVDEAETLADGIVNALDLSDVSVSPEMSVRGKISPSVYDSYGIGGGGVVVNNEVTAYTEYDLEQNLADLTYELSKI